MQGFVVALDQPKKTEIQTSELALRQERWRTRAIDVLIPARAGLPIREQVNRIAEDKVTHNFVLSGRVDSVS